MHRIPPVRRIVIAAALALGLGAAQAAIVRETTRLRHQKRGTTAGTPATFPSPISARN